MASNLGGSGGYTSDQMTRSNLLMTDRNSQRSSDLAKYSSKLSDQTSAALAAMSSQTARMSAGNAAALEVTKERAEAIKFGGKTMTKFERQESTRKLEVTKGVGNVKEADYSISKKDRLWAEDMLSKTPEYWDKRRLDAYNANVGDSCGNPCGSGCGGVASCAGGCGDPAHDITFARIENGRAYEGTEQQYLDDNKKIPIYNQPRQRTPSGRRSDATGLGTSSIEEEGTN